MQLIRWVVIAAIVVGIVLVAMDNRDDVRVGYAVGDAEAPIWIVIIIAAVAGVFIGWLVRHRPAIGCEPARLRRTVSPRAYVAGRLISHRGKR